MSKHFELTDDKIQHNGRTLYRIRALKDIPIQHVKKGDLGGYVESLKNLDNNAWVSDNAWVFGDAKVFGNADVFGDAKVFGNARVFGNAKVFDDVKVFDDAKVFGDAEVFDDAEVFGDAKVSGNAEVYGNARVFGNAEVFGKAKVKNNDNVYNKRGIASFSFPNSFGVTVTNQSIHIGCKTYTRDEFKRMRKEKAIKDGLPEELYFRYKAIIKNMLKLVG